MKPHDIFDLTNTGDLPSDLKKAITVRSWYGYSLDVLALFKDRNPLTTEEIMVGLWRKHKLNKKRANISSLIHMLVRNKKIRRVGRGRYEAMEWARKE